MNARAEGNGAERKGITQLRCSVIASYNIGTNRQPVWSEDVAQLPIGISNEGDAGAAVRVVLDSDYFRGNPAFLPLEINLALFLFVTAADMTRGQTTESIATAGLLLWLNQAFFRRPFCDLIESRQRLETQRRC